MRNPFVATISLVTDAAWEAGARVALIGGFALPFHGLRRATGDVDFLLEATGADRVERRLVEAGFRAVHRSDNAANFAVDDPAFAPADFLLARRPATLAMLARAKPVDVPGTSRSVPVVDVEGLIGLKVQAIANAPARRRQDEADIARLLSEHGSSLDLPLVRSYYRVFGMEADLERLLDEAKRS